MENLDLDIANYSIEEILSLFNLSYNFDEIGLKAAYKQTLMTHPDKSGLDKSYFLFFSKAFKKLKYIFDYRTTRSNSCTRETNYSDLISNSDYNDKHKENKLKEKIKHTNDFNEKFNKLFDKVRIYDDEQDGGYDDWIESTSKSTNEETNITNIRSLNEFIDKKKQEARDLVVYDGVKELTSSSMSCNNSNLKREKPKYYESGLFSKMQYEDYKRAHTETVIPVTYEDYLNKEKYNNVNELMSARKNCENLPSLEQANILLDKKKRLEQEESMNIAYNLTKQMEQIEKSNKIWMANFNLLVDK